MTKEGLLPPFYGEITLQDRLSLEKSVLPPEAQQYISDHQSDSEKYIVAEEDGKVVGFGVIHLPENKSDSLHSEYRYVFPEQRKRGISKKLRDATYDIGYEMGYRKVESGINNVVKISLDGKVEKNTEEHSDGGWKSYASMTESSAKTVVSHGIKFITIDQRGYVSIASETKLGADELQVFPKSPEGFMDFLRDGGTIPNDLTNQLLFEKVKSGGESFSVFKDGKQITFEEFLKLLR